MAKKCPNCKASLEKIGVVSEYNQVLDLKSGEYDSSDSEVGDTISTYCLECGSTLPKRFNKLTE